MKGFTTLVTDGMTIVHQCISQSGFSVPKGATCRLQLHARKDASFPRIGKVLHSMLSKPGHAVVSRIVPWNSATEILSFFDMEHQEEQGAIKKRKTKAWIPLESNPEVLNEVFSLLHIKKESV